MPDASFAPDGSFGDAGATPTGCLSCDPGNPQNGGCPTEDNCTSQVTQGGGVAYLCANPQGQTGCAFCSPSNPQNGGCPLSQSCTAVSNPQNGVIYVCEGPAGSDAGPTDAGG